MRRVTGRMGDIVGRRYLVGGELVVRLDCGHEKPYRAGAKGPHLRARCLVCKSVYKRRASRQIGTIGDKETTMNQIPNRVRMTEEQFIKLDPAFRTLYNAHPMTRQLPDGSLLPFAVPVEIVAKVRS
ncbi:MAG TPA: hypothetical protein VMH41_03495 [Mycobacteriales bacterium]|nr:hypothetical protein [Mycobacteriales bacterium]